MSRTDAALLERLEQVVPGGGTAAEAAAVPVAAAYASLNRTCELGMSRATGRAYRHILELLAEVTA